MNSPPHADAWPGNFTLQKLSQQKIHPSQKRLNTEKMPIREQSSRTFPSETLTTDNSPRCQLLVTYITDIKNVLGDLRWIAR